MLDKINLGLNLIFMLLVYFRKGVYLSNSIFFYRTKAEKVAMILLAVRAVGNVMEGIWGS